VYFEIFFLNKHIFPPKVWEVRKWAQREGQVGHSAPGYKSLRGAEKSQQYHKHFL